MIFGIGNLDLVHYKQLVKGPKYVPWGVETQIVSTCAGKNGLIADDYNQVQFAQLDSHPNMNKSMLKLVSEWIKIENLGIASSKKAMSENNKKPLIFKKIQLKFSTVIKRLFISRQRTPNSQITDGLWRNNFMSSEKLFKQKKSQTKRRRSFLINSLLMRTNLEKQAVPLMHLMCFRVNP